MASQKPDSTQEYQGKPSLISDLIGVIIWFALYSAVGLGVLNSTLGPFSQQPSFSERTVKSLTFGFWPIPVAYRIGLMIGKIGN